MNVSISPARTLRGAVRVPGDKSIAHRALILGALARGWTRITGVPRSADVGTTIRALDACGVPVQRNDDAAIVQGAGALNADGLTIDCENSGTTMRLLMGILAGYSGTVRLTGDGSLSRRPMRRIAEPLERMGARVELSNGGVAPVRVRGVSPLAAGDHVLPMRGAFVRVPGDPSSAAFLIAAAVLVPDGEIEVRDVSLNPTGAVAGLLARGDVTVQDALCAGVSFPTFYSVLHSLGARVA